MKFENIKSYRDEEFRRITGVKRTTFEKNVRNPFPALTKRLALGGPKPKLCLEDMLIACLEYIREYCTYAHVAASYGMSESQIFRIICWVEDTLVKDGTFSLPGRKALLKSDMEYEVVLIDVAESPVERSKKKQKRYYSGKEKSGTL